MKKITRFIISAVLLIPFLFIGTNEANAKCTYVKGYYRKNGTYVSGYSRGCDSGGGSSPVTESNNTNTQKTVRNESKPIINLYKGNTLDGSANINELVFVQGYYRKDGTYVRPHYRTHANHFIIDNFSYRGLSTLLPLSENKISFSSSKSLAAAELYLYSIVGKNKLTASQIKELKNYADLLTKASVKTQQTVTSTGKKFYQQFNFNSIFAEKQVTFDIKGALSIEDYVYHSLIQLGKTNLLSYEQDKLDNYIKKLTDLKKGIGVISSFQEDAKNFYTYSIGLSEKDASNQLEMDLLQIGLKMKASIYADLTKEIESYLTEMARTYQAQPLTYQQEFLRWSYAFNLDYVRKYPQYSWTLTDATSKGIAFYKSLGLTEESAMQQTQLDVAWIKEK